MKNSNTTPTSPDAGLIHAEQWGDGTPVVLVHGSLATGSDEWPAQRPLADLGYQLRVMDRRGYGNSPHADGEDFLQDAADIVELMGDGAHLVGHSYGGLAVMLAAARRPEATLSLTVLEAPAVSIARDASAWRALGDGVRALWQRDLPDREWVVEFLESVGSNPAELPAELLDAAVELVPVFRQGRPFYEAEVPAAELAAATFPKLVVSGGHHEGFEAMCQALAQRIGAAHEVIPGAGHEIQFTGAPINEALERLWSATP
jgi:pimeloyl-ACP methyl ester carboxylesterase